MGDKGYTEISNKFCYKFIMGEIEAAIGIEQLKKLDELVLTRQMQAKKLVDGLRHLKGLQVPILQKDNTNAFYIFPLVIDYQSLSISREHLIDALTAEGIQGLCNGYANIHQLPIFQKKIAYGSSGFPWSSSICKRNVSYDHGICPIAEELHEKSFIGFEICQLSLSDNDINNIIIAFEKVWQVIAD